MRDLDAQALVLVAAVLAIIAAVVVLTMAWNTWRQRTAEERWKRALEVDIDGVMRLREQIDLHTERALSDAAALDMRRERLTRDQADLVEQRENAVLETEHAHARLARAIETTARLESKVSAASERTTRLRESVSAARERRDKAQGDAQELEAMIDELDATLAQLEEAHREAEAEALEAETAAKSAQKDRDKLERDVDALEHQVSLTEADLAAQRSRLEQAKGQRDGLETQQAELQDQADQLRQRLRRLETEDNLARTALGDIDVEITSLRDDLAGSGVKHLRGDVDRLAKEVAERQAKLNAKQDERRQILEDLALVGRQRASLEGRRQVLEDELGLLAEQDKAATEHISKAEAEMQTLTRELAGFEEQLKGYEGRVHEQHGALQAMNQTLSEATGELEAALQRRDELRPKVESLRERNASLAASLVESGARLSESKANVVDVWADIDDALDELTRLGAAVNGREALTDALDLTAAAIASVGELAIELGRMAPGNSRHHPDPRILQAIATDAIDATLRDANQKIASVRNLLLQAEDERDNILETAGVDMSAVAAPEPLSDAQQEALAELSDDVAALDDEAIDHDEPATETEPAAQPVAEISDETEVLAQANDDPLGDLMDDMSDALVDDSADPATAIDDSPDDLTADDITPELGDDSVAAPAPEPIAEVSPVLDAEESDASLSDFFDAEAPKDKAQMLLEDAGEFDDFDDYEDDYEDPDKYSVLVDTEMEEELEEDVVVAVVDD